MLVSIRASFGDFPRINGEQILIQNNEVSQLARLDGTFLVLPVDTPLVTATTLLALADACNGDAAVPQTGPLPGAYRKSALPALESGELSIRRALERLEVTVVELDAALLANVNTPDDLRGLE